MGVPVFCGTAHASCKYRGRQRMTLKTRVSRQQRVTSDKKREPSCSTVCPMDLAVLRPFCLRQFTRRFKPEIAQKRPAKPLTTHQKTPKTKSTYILLQIPVTHVKILYGAFHCSSHRILQAKLLENSRVLQWLHLHGNFSPLFPVVLTSFSSSSHPVLQWLSSEIPPNGCGMHG